MSLSKYIIKKTTEIALALCPLNRQLNNSHVAFLVKSNKILHIGQNKKKTHPLIKHHPYHAGNVWLHAELDVILKSTREDLFNYKLVVLRVNRKHELVFSRPCIGCQSLIRQFGISEVFYSDHNGDFVKL